MPPANYANDPSQQSAAPSSPVGMTMPAPQLYDAPQVHPQPAPAPQPLAAPVAPVPAAASAAAPALEAAEAADSETLDAAWVLRVKQIFVAHHDDPAEESRQFMALKSDYLRQRYAKTLKTEQ